MFSYDMDLVSISIKKMMLKQRQEGSSHLFRQDSIFFCSKKKENAFLGKRTEFAFDMNLCHFDETVKSHGSQAKGKSFVGIVVKSFLALAHSCNSTAYRVLRSEQADIAESHFLKQTLTVSVNEFSSHEHFCNAENFPSPKHLAV